MNKLRSGFIKNIYHKETIRHEKLIGFHKISLENLSDSWHFIEYNKTFMENWPDSMKYLWKSYLNLENSSHSRDHHHHRRQPPPSHSLSPWPPIPPHPNPHTPPSPLHSHSHPPLLLGVVPSFKRKTGNGIFTIIRSIEHSNYLYKLETLSYHYIYIL